MHSTGSCGLCRVSVHLILPTSWFSDLGGPDVLGTGVQCAKPKPLPKDLLDFVNAPQSKGRHFQLAFKLCCITEIATNPVYFV